MSRNKWDGKIADLPRKQRKVLDALLHFWLENTEMGQHLLESFSVQDATTHLYELKERGLAEFVTNGLPFGRGGSFEVRPILPVVYRQ